MKIFYLLLVCSATALDRVQLRGLKRLLKNLDEGIYPTCNLIFFAEQVDYDTAESNCKNFNMGTAAAQEGNLATVNDDDKNTDLKMLLEMAYPIEENVDGKWGPSSWVWAGLRKTRNNGITGGGEFSKKYDPEDWSWADGSHPTEYKRWFNKKQPDQAKQKKGKDCPDPMCYQNQMRIDHRGKWDDTYKYKLHPYACDYQGKYIISASLHDWETAKKQCEDAGLHLAMVRNQGEIDEIVGAAGYFLGPRDTELREFDAQNWFWIGGRDDETGQDAMAISKWGKVDDSYMSKKRKRPFACQCPGS